MGQSAAKRRRRQVGELDLASPQERIRRNERVSLRPESLCAATPGCGRAAGFPVCLPGRGRRPVPLPPGRGPRRRQNLRPAHRGQRRRERGADVIAGFVEACGRPLTEELINGLEVIARKAVGYRGTRREEMADEVEQMRGEGPRTGTGLGGAQG
ncbi:MAG TPA: hypothetical protein VLW50_05865 [Streptosporangiaceae bacterium]|nr:hypothetical protein [Streptosporangiaceae bacterium]